MTLHYPDLGSASDWLNQISHAVRSIRSTTQIWVVTRHQYGISVLVSQASFGGETSDSVGKCWLFSKGTFYLTRKSYFSVTVWESVRGAKSCRQLIWLKLGTEVECDEIFEKPVWLTSLSLSFEVSGGSHNLPFEHQKSSLPEGILKVL